MKGRGGEREHTKENEIESGGDDWMYRQPSNETQNEMMSML